LIFSSKNIKKIFNLAAIFIKVFGRGFVGKSKCKKQDYIKVPSTPSVWAAKSV
jgi:hypothetical protein